MYDLIKNVIENGNFNLSTMIDKINFHGIKGNISDSEVDELINLARNKANFKNDIDLYSVVLEQGKRIKDLEEKVALLLSSNVDNDVEEDTEEVTYPEYVVGKTYYNGDKITFDNLIYVCTAPDGQVCVWSPTEYPAYWELA